MPVVTACSERVEFRAPVKQGERIELVGRVTDQGRSSLRVTIDMHREDLLTGDRSLGTTGEFVMVAVDSDAGRLRSKAEEPARNRVGWHGGAGGPGGSSCYSPALDPWMGSRHSSQTRLDGCPNE